MSDQRRSRNSAVRLARNPFETWVVVACVLVGVIALLPFNSPRSSVVDRYLPGFMVLPWYVGLLACGGITLVGIAFPVRTVRAAIWALGLERFGLIVLAGLLGGYGAAIEFVAPRTNSGLLTIGLAVACVGRFRQVQREFRNLENAVTNEVHAENRETGTD